MADKNTGHIRCSIEKEWEERPSRIVAQIRFSAARQTRVSETTGGALKGRFSKRISSIYFFIGGYRA
jgi:hypothetical protein